MSTWVQGNYYLSNIDDIMNNAHIIADYLSSKGWSINSISAVLGNMYKESTVNPQIWEGLTDNPNPQVDGYGLCGWTPAIKIANFTANWQNGEGQLEFLSSGYSDGTSGNHWGNSSDPHAPSVTPPVTWEEFKVSTLDVSTLASYFMYYYEKPTYNPSVNGIATRQLWARNFYDEFEVNPPTPIPPTTSSKSMPVYMMIRRFI